MHFLLKFKLKPASGLSPPFYPHHHCQRSLLYLAESRKRASWLFALPLSSSGPLSGPGAPAVPSKSAWNAAGSPPSSKIGSAHFLFAALLLLAFSFSFFPVYTPLPASPLGLHPWQPALWPDDSVWELLAWPSAHLQIPVLESAVWLLRPLGPQAHVSSGLLCLPNWQGRVLIIRAQLLPNTVHISTLLLHAGHKAQLPTWLSISHCVWEWSLYLSHRNQTRLLSSHCLTPTPYPSHAGLNSSKLASAFLPPLFALLAPGMPFFG